VVQPGKFYYRAFYADISLILAAGSASGIGSATATGVSAALAQGAAAGQGIASGQIGLWGTAAGTGQAL